MGNGNYTQTSFLGGAWSPLAQGRMDDPRYKVAMNICLNSYPVEEGAWTRRSGFNRLGHTRNGGPAKLVSFDVAEAAPADLELTDGHLRVIAGKQIIGDSAATVTNISTATPAIITVDSATGWAVDDQVRFDMGDAATKANCAALGNREFHIAPVSPTTFSIHDPITGVAFDGSTVTWSADNLISVVRVLDLVTPYTEDVIADVRLVQSGHDAILLQGETQPQIVTESSLDTDAGTGEFEINPAVLLDGPYLDPFTGSLATPSGVTGIISVTLSYAAWSATQAYKKGDYVSRLSVGYKSISDTNVNHQPPNADYWEVVSFGDPVGPNGFANTDIGRSIRLFSAGTTWTWGRITSFSTTGLVDPAAAGVSEIGNMVDNPAGGLELLFDGDFAKAGGDCAWQTQSNEREIFAWGGLKVNAGSTITAAVIYPATSGSPNGPWGNSAIDASEITMHLYGSNTLPSTWDDGTKLNVLTPNPAPQPETAVTLVSDDSVTSYKWMWVVMRWAGNRAAVQKMWASQIQFFDNTGTPGAAVNVEILGGDLASSAACTWRLGVYSDTTGWPKTGCYHEGRLWLAGAVDNRFDGSKSNDPYNFAPTAAVGTVGDSNAISYTLNAKDVNPIFWMEPNQQGIIMGTQGGEWLVQASAANNALTPTNIQAHRATRYRCANIEPVTVGLSTVFAQFAKRNLMEYISDVYSGKFFAPNLNELSRHLTVGGIEEICAQEGLTPIVWARRADGGLVGATYRRVSMHSSEPPKFLGWHEHALGSEYEVTSIAKAPSDQGLSDTVAIITRDPATGLHYVESMGQFFDADNTLEDAMFLDSAMTPVSAMMVGSTSVRFYGLSSFEGKTVSVFAAGIDCGEFVVASGYVTVPLSGDFTIARLAAVTAAGEDYGDLAVSIDNNRFIIPCAVGYTYTSRGQTLRPFKMEDTGARAGVAFGKTRRTHEYALLLHNTKGLSMGTVFGALRPCLFKRPGGSAYTASQLFSGIHSDSMQDDYSMDSMMAWEVTRPYPATVLAAGAFLQTQDK